MTRIINGCEIAALLEIPIVLIIIFQVLTKFFPLWIYLLSLVALGTLIGLNIDSQNRVFGLLQVFFLGILVRSIYFIATRFAVIPWGDPYGQYGVSRVFLEEQRVFLIQSISDKWPGTLLNCSGWPAIEVLAVIFSQVSSMDLFHLALIIPWIFFTNSTITAYLFFKEMERDLHLSPRSVNFALVVFVTSPYVFMPPIFKHQDMATMLFILMIYMAYKHISAPSIRNIIVLMLISSVLVVTHHYTTFLAVLFLLFLSGLFSVIKYLSSQMKHYTFSRAWFSIPFFNLGMFTFVLLFLWWDCYATVIWPNITSTIKRFTEVLKMGAFESPIWELFYPASATPNWALLVLQLRGFITVILGILGFLWLCRSKTSSPKKLFLVYCLIFVPTSLFIDVLFGFMGSQYTPRVMFLLMPLISLCVSIPFDKLKRKNFSAMLMLGVVVLLIFSSLIGLWAQRYIPNHLYDPTVNFAESGEHPTTWIRVKGFFDKYVRYEKIHRIVTDEFYVLSLIMPPDYWEKIQFVGYRGVNPLADNVVVVAFRELRTDSYMAQGMLDFYNPDYDRNKFQEELRGNLSLIYNDEQINLWRR